MGQVQSIKQDITFENAVEVIGGGNSKARHFVSHFLFVTGKHPGFLEGLVESGIRDEELGQIIDSVDGSFNATYDEICRRSAPQPS